MISGLRASVCRPPMSAAICAPGPRQAEAPRRRRRDPCLGVASGAETGVGWVDLDPTNALVVGEDHVRLAFGRDYADVAPVDGVIMASAGHTLDVSVDVAPSR